MAQLDPCANSFYLGALAPPALSKDQFLCDFEVPLSRECGLAWRGRRQSTGPAVTQRGQARGSVTLRWVTLPLHCCYIEALGRRSRNDRRGAASPGRRHGSAYSGTPARAGDVARRLGEG